MEGGVGFASIIPGHNITGRLPVEASIFTAELYAIKSTVEHLLENEGRPSNYTIFCDSQSVLQALKSSTYKSLIDGAIQLLLFFTAKIGIHINMCWFPGHCEIAGKLQMLKLKPHQAVMTC